MAADRDAPDLAGLLPGPSVEPPSGHHPAADSRPQGDATHVAGIAAGAVPRLGQGEAARVVLEARPDFADARYLLGKILLAQGTAEEAAAQLEAAARLSPEEANIHYQLAQAYQKLGRADAAREQFEVFQRLKEKRRGSAS